MDSLPTGGRSVVFVITGLAVGGAETQLVRLARALTERGWRVRVIYLLEPATFRPQLEALGIEVVHLDVRRFYSLSRTRDFTRIVRDLRSDPPEVICGFLTHGNWVARALGAAAGVRNLFVSVRSEHVGKRGSASIERALNLLTPWVQTITNSPSARARLIRERIVPEGRVHYIPNAIPAELHSEPANAPVTRESLGATQENFIWLCVGNFTWHKDYANLLNAFRMVVAARPDARLWIAGRAGHDEEVEELLRTSTGVSSLGPRSDVPALWGAVDAGVLGSREEGFPNAVLEAQLFKRPVVCTRVGAAPEIVIDEVTGFLVEPQNSSALADAMLRLMQRSEAQRQSMGNAARQHVTRTFALNAIVDRWIDCFSPHRD